MRVVQKKKEYWLLTLDKADDLNLIVEAIARASFELAKPAGISAITSFDPSTQWETVREHALKEIRSGADPNRLLEMDYVAGRRCKTSIVRGRKYLRVYPGDDRGQEMETMYILALRYLHGRKAGLRSVEPITDQIQ